MKSINISLPDGMRAYVEEQVADGGYSTISQTIRATPTIARVSRRLLQYEQTPVHVRTRAFADPGYQPR